MPRPERQLIERIRSLAQAPKPSRRTVITGSVTIAPCFVHLRDTISWSPPISAWKGSTFDANGTHRSPWTYAFDAWIQRHRGYGRRADGGVFVLGHAWGSGSGVGGPVCSRIGGVSVEARCDVGRRRYGAVARRSAGGRRSYGHRCSARCCRGRRCCGRGRRRAIGFT